MAAALAHHTRALRITHAPRVFCRDFSRSVPAFKKRRANTESRMAFEDDDVRAPADDDDLFSSRAAAAVKSAAEARQTVQQAKASRKSKAPSELFDEQYVFVADRLGPKPRANHPQVRANALRRLLHHSENGAQMERLVNLLIAWRSDGRAVDRETTVELIDRCLAWKPTLLVRLFADHPRYGLTIPSLEDGRRILHSLVHARPHPVAQSADAQKHRVANAAALRNAVAFAALFPAHGLPPATTDLTSCALLAQACARNVAPPPSAAKGEEGKVARAAPPSSQRGLVAIAADLVRALAPAGEQDGLAVEGGLWRVGKGNHAPSVAAKREGGFTQTGAVEWKWVTLGLQDVVNTLKRLDNKAYLKQLSAVLTRRLQKGGEGAAQPEVNPGERAQLA